MGAATAETWLPSYKELKVPIEINLTTPYLRAGARHMAAACEVECNEFMLCRREESDPRKCYKEGKEVTACGVKFLQRIKGTCRAEFDKLGQCIEFRGGPQYGTGRCLDVQRAFDDCVFEKLSVSRPPDGYLSKVHLHDTERPRPPAGRDYQAEAEKLLPALPPDSSLNRENYTHVKPSAIDLFSDI